MDCLDAQRLVSEKLDRATVDAAQLEVVKEHCRTCTECAAFVRALRTVVEAPLPEPSAGLHERIMGAVTAEGTPDSSPLTESPTFGLTREPPPAAGTGSLARLRSAFRDPRNERTIIAWTAAAAVVVVVAGIGAIEGVQLILAPSETATLVAAPDSAEWSAEMGYSESQDAGIYTDSPAAESRDALTASVAPPYISASGTVYRAAGPAVGIDPAALRSTGSALTSLDSADPPTTREVLRLDDPARVYIADGAGGYLGFDRVTRTYDGRVYALQSGDITVYGAWPTLPATVQRPASADGSPGYTQLGTDSTGVTVYGQGASAALGILVAPGTPAGDPAAGNPDWTWWAPAQ